MNLNIPHLIIRPGKVVGTKFNENNLLSLALKELILGNDLKLATDQLIGPIYVRDLCLIIESLILNNRTGTYHIVSDEKWSRFDLIKLLASELRDQNVNITSRLIPCSINDLNFLERRPLNTTLNNHKIKSLFNYKFAGMKELCQKCVQGFAKTTI